MASTAGGGHVVWYHPRENRNIPAAWQVDTNTGVASVGVIILCQRGAQPGCLDTHDRVNRGVEIGWAAEHIDRDRISLDRFGPALEKFGCDEAEKVSVAFGRLETGICQKPADLGLRLRLVDMFAE